MQWSFHHTEYWASAHRSKYFSCFALGKWPVKCLYDSKLVGEIGWARDLDRSTVMSYMYSLELEIFSSWRCKLYGNCLVVMYKPHVNYDIKCIWVWLVLNYILSRVFTLSLVHFGTTVMPQSLVLSLLIVIIIWGNIDSNICPFGVLHLHYLNSTIPCYRWITAYTDLKHDEMTLEIYIHVLLPLYVWLDWCSRSVVGL